MTQSTHMKMSPAIKRVAYKAVEACAWLQPQPDLAIGIADAWFLCHVSNLSAWFTNVTTICLALPHVAVHGCWGCDFCYARGLAVRA